MVLYNQFWVLGLKPYLEFVDLGAFKTDGDPHLVRNKRFGAEVVLMRNVVQASKVEATVVVVIDVFSHIYGLALVEMLHSEHHLWLFLQRLFRLSI